MEKETLVLIGYVVFAAAFVELVLRYRRRKKKVVKRIRPQVNPQLLPVVPEAPKSLLNPEIPQLNKFWATTGKGEVKVRIVMPDDGIEWPGTAHRNPDSSWKFLMVVNGKTKQTVWKNKRRLIGEVRASGGRPDAS